MAREGGEIPYRPWDIPWEVGGIIFGTTVGNSVQYQSADSDTAAAAAATRRHCSSTRFLYRSTALSLELMSDLKSNNSKQLVLKTGLQV